MAAIALFVGESCRRAQLSRDRAISSLTPLVSLSAGGRGDLRGKFALRVEMLDDQLRDASLDVVAGCERCDEPQHRSHVGGLLLLTDLSEPDC